MRGKQYELDMCSGSLAGKILVFAFPLMLSGMLQLLFNAADVIVVGRFCGKASLAAVGSNTSLINLFVNLFVGLSVGANVVVAEDLGAGREKEANRAVHSTILLARLPLHISSSYCFPLIGNPSTKGRVCALSFFVILARLRPFDQSPFS